MPTTPADRLRARALVLRTFARRMQHLEALTLYVRAGTDTWMGPSPQVCDDALRQARTGVLAQADQLIVTARRFERQATEMSVAAVAQGPTMSYLAYDPDRVDALLSSMRRSLDELRRTRCDDPAAVDAMRVLRSVTLDVDMFWMPLVLRTATTPSLTAGKRLPADLGELPNSLAFVMATGYGWSLVHDPVNDDPGVVTAEEARALGSRMNEADAVAATAQPESLRWLSSQLEIIGRDPQLSAQFLANFHEWAPWGDALGRRRARLLADVERDTRVTVADLDSVFAGLAHVQRAVMRPEPGVRGVAVVGRDAPVRRRGHRPAHGTVGRSSWRG